MRIVACFLISAVATMPLGAQSALERRVDAYFAAAVAGHDFSGSVLIARGDSVLVRKGYGLANNEWGIAATPDTRYIVASLTKTLTAAAIVRLRDQGKLGLGDTLSRYLPAFPHGPRITLTQLLAHESGVANPEYVSLFGRQVSLEQLVAEIGKQPLLFAPGTDDRYSNAGYNLLTAVIEKVTGHLYGVALRELVLNPAGMSASGDASDGAVVARLATPYVAGPGPFRARVADGNYSADVGAGSLYSTVDDLFRWARVIQTDRLFKLGSIPYSYGWGERKLAGGRWLEQTGLLDGWVSNIYVGRDSAIVVVVLGNHCTPSFARWGRELALVVMGGARADSIAPLAAELPAREVPVEPAAYVGRYTAQGFTARVTSSGGALYLEVNDWPVARYLAAAAPDRFVVGDFGLEVSFTRDAQGRVSGAVWGSGQGAMTLRRA
jgi:CubicO group peptidase (beta-lactamase class C family)